MQTNYTPQKINTASITLPDFLSKLVESLAKNNHDVWAQQRLADGWSWGPNRCDIKKHHPCLVPYEMLPEEEKRYDIILAEEIVKSIILLGYKIEKNF